MTKILIDKETVKAIVHELEYILDCINFEKMPFDGDDFHEALRLVRQALEQSTEQVPEFTKHTVNDANEWSEWVCPDPESYLMKCCDCGLVHEAQFGVVRYKSETEREDCDKVDDPNLQAVFRMRRHEAWEPEDTAHRVGGLPQSTEQEPVTILPDGSAFGVMSWPLPKNHWLYAEREYRDGEYEPVELGNPILTHQLRDEVVSAVRYAIRGATNCGKDVDFDPDALVQNAVYALCGPYSQLSTTQPQEAAPRKPLTDEQLIEIYLKTNGLEFYKSFARAIEAAHGIKGEA